MKSQNRVRSSGECHFDTADWCEFHTNFLTTNNMFKYTQIEYAKSNRKTNRMYIMHELLGR